MPNYYNEPLAAGTSNPRPRLIPPTDPDEPVIVLAFSGGGSRAAALGLSVLDQLARFSYKKADGTQVRLIDRVYIISSVSGGSVAAAWYGLVGSDRMDELKDRFLTKDNMATLEWQIADPITWARLAFSRYTRIDAMTQLFDDRLFDHKTFAAFNRPGAPTIILNSTDMASGEVFSFTPERFDDICSNLSTLPISAGVAASAAFPVALSPYNLQDFSAPNGEKSCKGAIPADKWIAKELDLDGTRKEAARYVDIEEFKRARYAYALRNGDGAYRKISYLHLIDGGVADNQGGHAISEAITSHSPLQLLYDINSGAVRRIVVISVNARSDHDNKLSQSADVPNMFDVINSVTSVPIDSTTAYSNASVQVLVNQLNSLNGAPGEKHEPPALRVYNIPIDFDQFHNDQSALRDRVKAIGTSWNLTAENLQDTLTAGQLLLTQHPCFQHLLQDIKIPADFIDASFVQNACRLSGDKQPGNVVTGSVSP